MKKRVGSVATDEGLCGTECLNLAKDNSIKILQSLSAVYRLQSQSQSKEAHISKLLIYTKLNCLLLIKGTNTKYKQ